LRRTRCVETAACYAERFEYRDVAARNIAIADQEGGRRQRRNPAADQIKLAVFGGERSGKVRVCTLYGITLVGIGSSGEQESTALKVVVTT
jgi:hypothetical protein